MKKKKIYVFDVIVGIIFALLCFIAVYPFIYAFSYSISDGMLAQQKNIMLLPAGFTLQNYQMIFSDKRILNAVLISVLKTVSGTLLFLIVTGLCAYSMSKPRMKFRKILFVFLIIPMYMSGGMLPTYVLIYDLHLINNFLVYILPACYSTFFMLLMKTYLETIPSSIEESVKIDGGGELRLVASIYFPLSIPVIATVMLFTAVAQWNSWFDALLYVTDKSIHPLQMVLQTILQENSVTSLTALLQSTGKRVQISSDTYKMAVLMVTTIPIIIIYPFAQKYFIQGMTMGSVKL